MLLALGLSPKLVSLVDNWFKYFFKSLSDEDTFFKGYIKIYKYT